MACKKLTPSDASKWHGRTVTAAEAACLLCDLPPVARISDIDDALAANVARDIIERFTLRDYGAPTYAASRNGQATTSKPDRISFEQLRAYAADAGFSAALVFADGAPDPSDNESLTGKAGSDMLLLVAALARMAKLDIEHPHGGNCAGKVAEFVANLRDSKQWPQARLRDPKAIADKIKSAETNLRELMD